MQHLLLRTVGRGAAAALELLARTLLLLLALLLPWAPSSRTAAIERLRSEFARQVEWLSRLGVESLQRRSASLADAAEPEDLPYVLVVGDASVGKSTLVSALSEFAASSAIQLRAQESRATPALRGGDARAAGAVGNYSEVRLGIIVWEATLDRPLASYASEYAQRLLHSVNGMYSSNT